MTTAKKSAAPKATPAPSEAANKVVETRNAQAAAPKPSAADIIEEANKVAATKTNTEATANAAAPATGAGVEAAGVGSGSGAALPWGGIPQNQKDDAYVAAFNRYDELYGRQPSDDFTTDQLIRLNIEKENAGKSEGELGNVNAAPGAGSAAATGSEFQLDEEDLMMLRKALFKSTPEQRKKLKDLLAEFDTEPAAPAAAIASSAAVQAKPELTEEEKLEAEEKETLQKYGAGYVKAVNGSGMPTIFSARAWSLMGPDKDGWKRKVETPAELRGFKK